MALWRAEAAGRLPQLQSKIAAAETVMALWIELLRDFEEAYRSTPPDEQLIAGVYSFADWCLLAPRNDDAGRDPTTAVVVVFHEHIATVPAARDDMPRWFTAEQVLQNRSVFGRFVDDSTFAELMRQLRRNRHRYRGRPGDLRAQ